MVLIETDAIGSAFESSSPLWIDMPIGVPSREASRTCDRAVRKLLPSGYAATVFNPPVRAALDVPTYAEACTASEEACGKRLSKQTWFLVPKIRSLDRALRLHPDPDQVFEAHPELSWAALAHPHVLPKKHTEEGLYQRRSLLAALHSQAGDLFEEIVGTLRRYEAGVDDVLDAMVLAYGAAQAASGGAVQVVPTSPARDDCGRLMRIVGLAIA